MNKMYLILFSILFIGHNNSIKAINTKDDLRNNTTSSIERVEIKYIPTYLEFFINFKCENFDTDSYLEIENSGKIVIKNPKIVNRLYSELTNLKTNTRSQHGIDARMKIFIYFTNGVIKSYCLSLSSILHENRYYYTPSLWQKILISKDFVIDGERGIVWWGNNNELFWTFLLKYLVVKG